MVCATFVAAARRAVLSARCGGVRLRLQRNRWWDCRGRGAPSLPFDNSYRPYGDVGCPVRYAPNVMSRRSVVNSSSTSPTASSRGGAKLRLRDPLKSNSPTETGLRSNKKRRYGRLPVLLPSRRKAPSTIAAEPEVLCVPRTHSTSWFQLGGRGVHTASSPRGTIMAATIDGVPTGLLH